jgi:hypothetical protein
MESMSCGLGCPAIRSEFSTSFCYRDFIVLTNVFRKNTVKVPEFEIRKAKRCREDFLARVDEEKLRELVQ